MKRILLWLLAGAPLFGVLAYFLPGVATGILGTVVVLFVISAWRIVMRERRLRSTQAKRAGHNSVVDNGETVVIKLGR